MSLKPAVSMAYEQVNYAAFCAFERVTGNAHAFDDALDLRQKRDRTPRRHGEDFDFSRASSTHP
jgi:hypothetical protein